MMEGWNHIQMLIVLVRISQQGRISSGNRCSGEMSGCCLVYAIRASHDSILSCSSINDLQHMSLLATYRRSQQFSLFGQLDRYSTVFVFDNTWQKHCSTLVSISDRSRSIVHSGPLTGRTIGSRVLYQLPETINRGNTVWVDIEFRHQEEGA